MRLNTGINLCPGVDLKDLLLRVVDELAEENATIAEDLKQITPAMGAIVSQCRRDADAIGRLAEAYMTNDAASFVAELHTMSDHLVAAMRRAAEAQGWFAQTAPERGEAACLPS